ncbi:hypothetical protein L7F22_049042 [Adiantum nelumboides]|nr:hypothetical protein [Adiantum nelumboides]
MDSSFLQSNPFNQCLGVSWSPTGGLESAHSFDGMFPSYLAPQTSLTSNTSSFIGQQPMNRALDQQIHDRMQGEGFPSTQPNSTHIQEGNNVVIGPPDMTRFMSPVNQSLLQHRGNDLRSHQELFSLQATDSSLRYNFADMEGGGKPSAMSANQPIDIHLGSRIVLDGMSLPLPSMNKDAYQQELEEQDPKSEESKLDESLQSEVHREKKTMRWDHELQSFPAPLNDESIETKFPHALGGASTSPFSSDFTYTTSHLDVQPKLNKFNPS